MAELPDGYVSTACRGEAHDECKEHPVVRCACSCHDDGAADRLGWAAVHGGVLSQELARRLRFAFDQARGDSSSALDRIEDSWLAEDVRLT